MLFSLWARFGNARLTCPLSLGCNWRDRASGTFCSEQQKRAQLCSVSLLKLICAGNIKGLWLRDGYFSCSRISVDHHPPLAQPGARAGANTMGILRARELSWWQQSVGNEHLVSGTSYSDAVQVDVWLLSMCRQHQGNRLVRQASQKLTCAVLFLPFVISHLRSARNRGKWLAGALAEIR